MIDLIVFWSEIGNANLSTRHDYIGVLYLRIVLGYVGPQLAVAIVAVGEYLERFSTLKRACGLKASNRVGGCYGCWGCYSC